MSLRSTTFEAGVSPSGGPASRPLDARRRCVGPTLVRRIAATSRCDCERLATAEGCIATTIGVAEQPARASLDYIEQQGIDLVIMPTRGLSSVKRFILGSVAGKVLRGASVPTLLTKRTDTDTP